MRTVLNLTGAGSYIIYLRATPNSLLANGNPGTYYAVDLTNPTCTNGSCLAYLFVFKSVAGSLSVLSASQVTCRSGSVMRAVIHGTAIAVWMDSELYQLVGDTSIASGQPGVGVINTAATSSLTQVQFGAIDTTPPYPVTQQSIGTSSFPNRVDLQWAGVTDTPGGIGLAYYDIYRNGTWLAHTIVPEFSDTTVSASTSYTYLIAPVDYHLNATPTTFTVQTVPGSVDPRRVGVRSTGSYWGASSMGENLDLLSGNLNFSLPLLKPVSRGGWGVTLKLSYNSQNWRQDPGGTWLLGRDVGYGFGWRLMAGSLTPYYSGYWSLDHYVFTDSTGAEYRLTQVNNGVWTSQEGIYLSYDSNAQRLYFPDGSFWVMGCMAAGDEQDAGTMYPTQMEDTNGNQINITYNAGLGAPWANSSARINTIQDIRDNGGQQIYSFTYDPQTPLVPHLIGIANNIGTAESYTLHYVSDPLQSPFGPQSYGVTSVLDSVQINNLNLTYSFIYDAANSGELIKTILPTGGAIGWGYENFTYVGSRAQPEVDIRSTYDGAATQIYTSGRDPNDGNRTVHYLADWYDPSGTGDKAWIFNTSGPYIGLVATYLGRQLPGYIEKVHLDYTWTADAAGNPYIGTVTTTNDTGQTYAVQKKVTQTQDAYGNLLQMQIYDWGAASSTPSPGPVLRTYTNTYLTNSNYTSRYIYNRLVTSKVADATYSTILVSNTYDTYNYCAGTLGLGGPASPPFHDAAYSSTFLYRGNVTQSTTPAGTSCRAFDIMGNAVATQDPAGRTYTTNINAGTNYAAPSAITTNSTLTENLTWSSFLGLAGETGPNGDSSTTFYDSFARPYSTKSPYGATTTYAYTPNTTTATVNGRWTKTTVDGLGRPILVETGYNSTTLSQVDSVYGPCACSPLGKLMKKSQPHAPGATKYWTTYTYDGIGRTIAVQLPDGASTTTYGYWSNVVGVWDPAGNWKHFLQDANGNLTLVREPNQAVPNGSADFYTSYSYDILNHLIGVSMTRSAGTQTRSFNYNVGNSVGAFLLSKSEPETGTTQYTYSGGLLQTKVDANNSKTQYTYDSYGRVKMIQHYPHGSPFFGSEDTFQQVKFYYDNDTTGYSQNALGRQTAVQYQGAGCGAITPATQNPVNPNTFVEMYNYSQAGLIVGNELLVSQTPYGLPALTADLEATYTYNNEGAMTGMTYPSSAGSGVTGDTYTYSFDSMNRPIGLTDQTNAQTVVSGVTYGPAGEMKAIDYGAINESRTYNRMLQLTAISAFNVGLGHSVFGRQYSYSGTQNNGKIQSETDTISGEVVTYQYDWLNRLASAGSSSWGQSFAYDGFGNLTDKNVTAGSAPTYHTSFNAATNRESGATYDDNGNRLTIPNATLGYDVENRMVTANPTGLEDVYAYGRGNRRVYAAHWHYDGSKYDLDSEKVNFYSVTGQKLGTYALQLYNGPPGSSTLTFGSPETRVWFGGKLVMLNGQPVTPDRLGSFGTYYPYGEDRGTAILRRTARSSPLTHGIRILTWIMPLIGITTV